MCWASHPFVVLKKTLSGPCAPSLKLGEAVRQGRRCCCGPPCNNMCEPCKPDALLEAMRGLHVADPDLGAKPLLAKLRDQQLDLGAGTREVREALMALKAESEAKATIVQHVAAAAPPATAESGAPPNVMLSLACFGCARLPSDMGDDREKHPGCPKCVKYKVPTTNWCCVNCPGNPGAWKLHAVYHKEVKKQWKLREDGVGDASGEPRACGGAGPHRRAD